MTTLARLRPYAPLLLRVFGAWKLFDAAGHTALHPAEGLPGYAAWLSSLGFPFPLAAAALSAYAEFFGGILVLVGWHTRWAAAVLLVNFVLAVAVGHLAVGDSYAATFPALALLATAALLLLNGPGRPSVDEGL